ncbi:MAG: class II aldolase/adducin family protein [Planctomycetota bacterium]
MNPDINRLANEIVYVCHKLAEYEFVAATDGNVSARIDGGRMLVTPTSLPKGEVTVDDLIICDMDGNKLEGKSRASTEVRMHVEAYRRRDDINAIVHAHPITATAFTVADISLSECVLPEVVFSIGSIQTCPYATPGTEEVPRSVATMVEKTDALLLERHGVLTLGVTPTKALHKMEKVEHTAKVVFMARQLGGARPLASHEVEKLMEVRRKLELPGRVVSCPEGSPCALPIETMYASEADDQPNEQERLIEEVVLKVVQAMKR